jgi:hypothetical protein
MELRKDDWEQLLTQDMGKEIYALAAIVFWQNVNVFLELYQRDALPQR